MRGLTIKKESLSDGWTTIGVGGEIDLATADALKAAIDEVLAEGAGSLVVDLSESSFMDSTGLRVLVMAHREFEEAGRGFAIAVSGGPISRLIDLSGVGVSMRVVETPSQAVEA